MTYDFQLGQTCPHLTVEEEVPLGSDRRSLVTRQPIASASRVRITANNSVSIPSVGLLSRASITGTVSGPFSIPSYAREIEVITRTETLQVSLPVGTRVPSKDVVQAITVAMRASKVSMAVSESKGVLTFQDTKDRGTSSTIRVGGDAGPRLGFGDQVRSRGRMVYPGWSMAEQEVLRARATPSQPKIVTARYPKFLAPIRGNPVFKVTYTTYQNYCLRCLSYGIENDYRAGQDGNYLMVRDDDKLNQDSLKILTTVRGSNPYFPDYGSNLLNRIGIKAVGSGVSTITEDVTRALQLLQRIQDITGKYQALTPKETLQTILSVVTTPSEFDPTVFGVEVVVSNASADPIVIRTVFAAPGTAALAGTNGLSLGLAERGVDPRLTTIAGI